MHRRQAAARPAFWLALVLLWLIQPGSTQRVQAQQLAFQLAAIEAQAVQPGALLSVAPQTSQVTAVCFLGTQCPMARGYVPQLNELQRQFADRGLHLVGVMSNRQDSAADIRGYIRELAPQFPIVQDVENRVADRYGASRTPEVFLLDADLKLRYHGRIDDRLAPGVVRPTATREDLKLAIEQLLDGKPIAIRETPALGCIIGRVKKSPQEAATGPSIPAGTITFSEHVSRVLQRHCMDCHRAGEIGPFSMERYDEVVGWAETMLETVENGRMPPWHADPAHGSFLNERIMPEADKQILREWIAAGLPQGDASLLPEPATFVEGWQLPRAPDLVVPMRSRPFTVPRSGVVEYQYFVADPGFQEDRWITAAQVVPGSRDVVHHAIVFVRPPDGAAFRGIGWLTAYVPGQRVYALPPGRARKVPAGSKLVFQMHYTPNGMEQDDLTEVGLLFGRSPEITHEVLTLLAVNQEFEIPPEARRHTVQASTNRLPRAGELLAITPHMHFRGSSFELRSAARPDEILLSVPRYDFNWQHTYQLREPLPLDGLEALQFTASFDNSSHNPFNPDPAQTVSWGEQSWEEMAVAFFDVASPLQQPAAAESAAGLGPSRGTAADQPQVLAYVERVMKTLDTNGDGVIKKAEAGIVVRHLHFGLWDLDGDNVATLEEVRTVAQRLYLK